MKPISKHKSVHYATTPAQNALKRKYRYNRLVSRLIKDIRLFTEEGAAQFEAEELCDKALAEAQLESINNGNR